MSLPVAIEVDEDAVYRCRCSWVGDDPDIGPGRGLDGRGWPLTAPTCPACWHHDHRRVVVQPETSS